MGVGQIAHGPGAAGEGDRERAPLAIVDRDGTVIDVFRDEETGVIVTAFHPDQIRFLGGALDGLRRLVRAGFKVAIATNQPGPAKGQCSANAVARTNDALEARLRDEGIAVASLQVCMHHPKGGEGGDPRLVGPCDCRKPFPGLLLAALKEADADSARSWMIGDTRSDIEAGRAAGVRTALVFSQERCELCPLRADRGDGREPGDSPDVSGATLVEIAEKILAQVGT